jgi:hypothetical protein
LIRRKGNGGFQVYIGTGYRREGCIGANFLSCLYQAPNCGNENTPTTNVYYIHQPTREFLMSEIEYMQDPSKWANNVGGVCPIKRGRDQEPNVGILTSSLPYVFFINMWDITGLENLRAIPHKRYNSHEELVKDGWRVD